MDSRYYPGVEADVSKLVTELRSLLDEDYEVQTMQVSSTSVMQARKSNTLRDLTGLSSALTIKITPEAGGTRVEIGMQKWFDKAAVAAVGAIVFAPLVALAAIGAYWPAKPAATFRLCPAAVALAEQPTAPAQSSAHHAARTCR